MQKTMKSTKPQKDAKNESFAEVAQRLGDALADVIEHPNCPAEVADTISELDSQVFNRCNDLEISLRHSFAYRLVGMLERSA